MYKVKILKKILAIMLCLSFVLASAVTNPLVVQAKPTPGLVNDPETIAYINQCENSINNLWPIQPSIKKIADAYLVGEDDMATASWIEEGREAHELYAVDPNTEIQGHVYDRKYYPQDNLEYLKDIYENYSYGAFAASSRLYRMSEGAQYIEDEGCMFQVVAFDEEWVTVWDRGYQTWNSYYSQEGIASSGTCEKSMDAFLQTHPAGFYKIQRNKVWIDFWLKENHPYTSEAQIPKEGNGIVIKLANLRPVPDEGEKTYTPVYALPTGTEVNVVSTQLVPSKTSGSTVKYYKVSFNGSEKVQNNGVGYLQYEVPGVYYLDSRYLNFTRKGTKTPAGAVQGEITNVKGNENVYAYQSKDTGSQQVGILSLGAEIEMFPSESDANWTTVYFSGQKAYVQTKYIKKAPYKVTDISKLVVADVVKDEIKMSWNAGKNNAEYSYSISMNNGNKKKVLYSNKHYKKNSFIIKRKYIEKATRLDIKVQATDKNGKKGKTLSCSVLLPSQDRKPDKRLMVIGKTSIKGFRGSSLGESLQYSTNKKFKKAVIVEKYSKNKYWKRKMYNSINKIKKLKKNTTYYIRRREKMEIKTAKGVKWISGKWSKSIKVKTKK